MKIRSVTAIPAGLPYIHREVGFQVTRDGLSDVVIRGEAEDDVVIRGETAPYRLADLRGERGI